MAWLAAPPPAPGDPQSSGEIFENNLNQPHATGYPILTQTMLAAPAPGTGGGGSDSQSYAG